MKLYIMKREALETLKANLEIVYAKYYTESTNEWIHEVCGQDAFIEFKEVPDFELAQLDSDYGKGEIDLLNCKIVFEKLMFLSESQASDERLWAGLTHATFYDYMRKRWGYGYGKKPKNAEKEAGEIKTRFFYGASGRSGFYRNTLAKCWWVGRNTYDANCGATPFKKLDDIGSNDISSKISTIFYNYNFSSVPYIMDGIVDALRYFKDEGILLSAKDHIRPAMTYLNAVGGSVVIDCLPKEEITEILVNAIEGILQGDSATMELDDADDVTEEFDSTSEDEAAATDEGADISMTVSLGCKVRVRTESGIVKTYLYDYHNGNIPMQLRNLAGLSVGDAVEVGGISCIIEAIEI